MRNAQVSEWILSLVTTPERAASTIGDLMENTARHGTFWFWMGVARTTLSLLWGGVAESPGRMARRAVGAFLLGWGLVLIGSLVIFVPLFAFFGPQIPPALLDESNLKFWPWIFVSVVIGGILVPFQQGRWMARWSPGQELAACLSLTILSVGVGVIQYAVQVVRGAGTSAELPLSIVASVVPMFAGAVWVRRKRLSH